MKKEARCLLGYVTSKNLLSPTVFLYSSLYFFKEKAWNLLDLLYYVPNKSINFHCLPEDTLIFS